jgi:hypothetical protein
MRRRRARRKNPARSERQRRLFGAALACKRRRGRACRSRKVRRLARLSTRVLREFARRPNGPRILPSGQDLAAYIRATPRKDFIAAFLADATRKKADDVEGYRVRKVRGGWSFDFGGAPVYPPRTAEQLYEVAFRSPLGRLVRQAEEMREAAYGEGR